MQETHVWEGRVSRKVETTHAEDVSSCEVYYPRPESQEGLKLSIERGGGLVAGADSARIPASRSPSAEGPARPGGPAYRRLFRQPSLSFGKGPAIFSPQRSQPRRGPPAERFTQTRRPASKSKPPQRRLLAVYTGASSPSLLSSFLSALWAVGHVQASVDAASSTAASASHVRIFHLGLSLQRLATYSAAANALAS